MNKEQLNILAREILDGAHVCPDKGEDGWIQVDSNLLFRYYVLSQVLSKKNNKATLKSFSNDLITKERL